MESWKERLEQTTEIYFFLTTLQEIHRKTQSPSPPPHTHTHSADTASGLVPVVVLEDTLLVLISVL